MTDEEQESVLLEKAQKHLAELLRISTSPTVRRHATAVSHLLGNLSPDCDISVRANAAKSALKVMPMKRQIAILGADISKYVSEGELATVATFGMNLGTIKPEMTKITDQIEVLINDEAEQQDTNEKKLKGRTPIIDLIYENVQSLAADEGKGEYPIFAGNFWRLRQKEIREAKQNAIPSLSQAATETMHGSWSAALANRDERGRTGPKPSRRR